MDVLTHRLGLPEPAPHLLVTNAPDGTRAAGIVSSRLARLFEVRDYTHIGGVAERERSGVVMVVVLSRRRLTLRPLPRRLDGPGAFRLEGRLAAGYRRPELAHMLPDGRTGREPLGEGKAFGRTVLLAERGRHRIEVLAQGPEGSIVLANFPVFVGVPVDEKAEADAPPGPAVRADEVRDALLALINAARARAGLDPVSPDPVLDEAARRHSEDMCDNGFIAHVSPTAGGTDERLARAGIVAILAAENVGKGYGAEELHGGFMDSPGHRGAVLLDRATHVGIGVAAKKEGDLTTYYATEIFIRRIPPLPADAKSRLLRELDARRGSAGLGRLAEDGSLSEMAETAARGFLLDPSLSQNDAARRLAQRLEGTFKMRTSLTVLFSVVGSVEDSARQAAADKHCLRARQIGIGLAQGDRPGLPANAIVLVLIFSE